ncbi:aspartyl-phosphate phosphatase Spo0E family protein [Paenibacillus sp. y28]|uniref:aspartyl-phosphate phosphatase Spo0E family protein n=1 Tax=Paenibacillus sp. y28 TaxID=3129110 RepID=UPI00301675B1
MNATQQLQMEIDRLKLHLEVAAMQYNYDFGHPDVIELSQRLDKLIVQFMEIQTAM